MTTIKDKPKSKNRLIKFIFYSCVFVVVILIGYQETIKMTATCLSKKTVSKILAVEHEYILVEFTDGTKEQLKQPIVKIDEEVCIKYQTY